ncbi:unnamed protein product [Heterobilharzia americana]|nr:unnamed protein product [Heterobilharzia americana]
MSGKALSRNDSHEWHPYVRQYGYYDPVTVGSIDGTDTTPHDRAIHRALSSSYKPKGQALYWNPKAILFIGRLPYYTSKVCLQEALNKLLDSQLKNKPSGKHTSKRRNRGRSPFSSNGHDDEEIWPKVHIVHNAVTGYPCGYAFAYFSSELDVEHVLRNWCSQTTPATSYRGIKDERHCGLDIPNGDKVILEPYFGGTLSGWRPRRLGGGLGGRKEAGQLRFGGVARPFRRPFIGHAVQ